MSMQIDLHDERLVLGKSVLHFHNVTLKPNEILHEFFVK